MIHSNPEDGGAEFPLGGASGLRRHLLQELFPLWYEHGIDRQRGGFHPKLTLDLRPGPDCFKRLVATARQIYSFSHAALLGAPDWSLEAAQFGLAFMTEKFWDPRFGGWFLTTDLSGEPLDRRKDSYAHAFVLFSMAYYYRATKDPEALRIAQRTLDLLERYLREPRHGGFLEGATEGWDPISEPRRQNPHMHLLEAFLTLYDVTREPRYLEHARAIADLFRTKFLDRTHGCLGEYFQEDWSPHPAEIGRVIEPGHHFEWVWLLHRYAELAEDDSIRADAWTLYTFASRFGIDPDRGGVYDEIDRQGNIVRDTKRLWPQTEWVKASVARYESSADPTGFARLRQALAYVFSLYVDPGHHGWKDHLTREGELFTDLMPATSLYHITLALSEVIRGLETLSGQGRN